MPNDVAVCANAPGDLRLRPRGFPLEPPQHLKEVNADFVGVPNVTHLLSQMGEPFRFMGTLMGT